jgi:hypothetical protein
MHRDKLTLVNGTESRNFARAFRESLRDSNHTLGSCSGNTLSIRDLKYFNIPSSEIKIESRLMVWSVSILALN